MENKIIDFKPHSLHIEGRSENTGSEDNFFFNTPEPESYDNIDQYRFYKALKEADGNASGLERQLNEREYQKFINGDDNADIRRAEMHHNLTNALLEEMRREFKMRENLSE